MKFCVFVFIFLFVPRFSFPCHPLYGSSYLDIEPQNDIYGQVNEPLTVKCVVSSEAKFSAIDIRFTKGNFEQFPSSLIQAVDNRTLQLIILEGEATSYDLYCRGPHRSYCISKVIIGHPPLAVTNFGCISRSWKSLECAYDVMSNQAQMPQNDYYLYYTVLEERAYGYKCNREMFSKCCQGLRGQECWHWGGDPALYPYYCTEAVFTFTLSSENIFGKASYTYTLNHYEIMVPDPVSEFCLVSKGQTRIALSWKLPEFLSYFPAAIIYRINYFGAEFEDVKTGIFKGNTTFSTEINVPWPGHTYTVTISLRSGANAWAPGDPEDGLWSRPITRRVTTDPSPPWKAPIPGGFQVANRKQALKSVVFYWQEMRDCFKGGPGFRYVFSVFENGRRIEIDPVKVANNYAVFDKLKANNKYAFKITPRNEVGTGDATTVIELERDFSSPSGLTFPLSLYFPLEKVFYFRWFPKDLSWGNFTLFWCDGSYENERAFGEICKGKLNWKHLQNESEITLTEAQLGTDQEHFNVTAALGRMMFGISSTKRTGGRTVESGIVWSQCSVGSYVPENMNIAPEIKISERNPFSVTVEWDLECSIWQRIPTGFEMAWCKGHHNSTTDCSGLKQVINIDQTALTIDTLAPSQNYTAWLRLIFKTSNISEVWGPLHFQTLGRGDFTSTVVWLTLGMAAALTCVVVILLYSPRKLVFTWNSARQKLNLPHGLNQPQNTNTVKKQHEPSYSTLLLPKVEEKEDMFTPASKKYPKLSQSTSPKTTQPLNLSANTQPLLQSNTPENIYGDRKLDRKAKNKLPTEYVMVFQDDTYCNHIIKSEEIKYIKNEEIKYIKNEEIKAEENEGIEVFEMTKKKEENLAAGRQSTSKDMTVQYVELSNLAPYLMQDVKKINENKYSIRMDETELSLENNDTTSVSFDKSNGVIVTSLVPLQLKRLSETVEEGPRLKEPSESVRFPVNDNEINGVLETLLSPVQLKSLPVASEEVEFLKEPHERIDFPVISNNYNVLLSNNSFRLPGKGYVTAIKGNHFSGTCSKNSVVPEVRVDPVPEGYVSVSQGHTFCLKNTT